MFSPFYYPPEPTAGSSPKTNPDIPKNEGSSGAQGKKIGEVEVEVKVETEFE